MSAAPLALDWALTEDWAAYAACAAVPDLPWLRDVADVSAHDALTMSVVCDSCPVREICESAVVDWGITGGWWAGRDRDPRAAQPLLAAEWVLLASDDLGGVA